jgi:predicted deacylase
MNSIITQRAAGPAQLDIPLDQPGRHVGALRLPYSSDRSAYGQIVIPVVVVRGGPGPTVLLTAGVHGDEYEGQIALGALSRKLQPEGMNGRVIIVPMANPFAALASLRTSPIDGGNLARSFPGDPVGSLTSQIAEGISRLLLPIADFLVDLHSGGSTLEYTPCGFGRLSANRALSVKVVDLMAAFGAPISVFVRQPESRGTLLAAALEMGVVAIATELGGGGGVTPSILSITERGLQGVLAHAGVFKDAERPIATTRFMQVSPKHFVRSPGRGMFEPLFALGNEVNPGQLAGRLWNPERIDQAPEHILFDTGGRVICRRVPAMVAPGDVLVHLAEDISREELLS